MAPPYTIGGSYPRELKHALSGFPCTVKDDLAALEIKFEHAAVLTGIKVHGTSFVEVKDSCKRRLVSQPIFIHVRHQGPHSHDHDFEKSRSSWTGRIECEAGQSRFIMFTPCMPDGSECKVDGAFMEFRDVSVTVQSSATGLPDQLAALFDDRVLLSACGDDLEVQLAGGDGGQAPASLFVSKFVLQLRSPVFRACLASGAYTEASTRRLRLHDFPDGAVRGFMEVLHRDSYSSALAPHELVAMFALGDKYDVPSVQELVYNRLSELEFSSTELREAVEAIRRYQAAPLRKSLLKKLRQLGDDEFCNLVYGDADEQAAEWFGSLSDICRQSGA